MAAENLPAGSSPEWLPSPEERLSYLHKWMGNFSVRLDALGFREILDLGTDFHNALRDMHALQNIEKLEADYRHLILRMRYFQQQESQK